MWVFFNVKKKKVELWTISPAQEVWKRELITAPAVAG